MKPPKELKPPGKALWNSVLDFADIAGCEPLLAELCKIADRLHQVREQIAEDGLVDEDGKKHTLADLETRLVGQYLASWKMLGLADSGEPRRPVGRPPESERKCRG